MKDKKFLIMLFFLFASQLFAQTENLPKNVVYHFVELIPTEKSFESTDLQKIQMDHMKNIRKLASEGKLLLAGPFKDGGGLFVLNTNSIQKAENWVQEDPAVKAGRFKYKIRTWYTQTGMLTLENSNSKD
ncbi:YciI family protein [uncultured Psychroserpens sp.]|uniref:YciI family protein n=1 Tax=uncultured Psychroserpens sp. TaxID=255436 RepID=UPI002614CF01|nr:YciI family protein [uncultured Psychroserpens sp.]